MPYDPLDDPMIPLRHILTAVTDINLEAGKTGCVIAVMLPIIAVLLGLILWRVW